MVLAQATLHELGGFFGGLAALMTILWTIWMFAAKRFAMRIEKSVQQSMDVAMMRIKKQRLLNAIEGLQPDEFYTHDVVFENGIRLAVPMIPNMDVEIGEGLTISVMYHDSEGTTLALKASMDTMLPSHAHHFTNECLEVRRGTVTHLESGRVYRSGETWLIQADEFHSAVFSAGSFCVIVCRPHC